MAEVLNNHRFVSGLISIIIPVYNCEKYLHKCLGSVINQDYKMIELILINDGSTDNSEKICRQYEQSDKRIQVITVPNGGSSAARNIGIKTSTGEFIFFLDADDFVDASAMSFLVGPTKENNVDMVISDYNKIIDSNVSFGFHDDYFSSSKRLIKQDIIDYARHYLRKPSRFPLFAYGWGRLFKSSIIKKNNLSFNVELHTFEDVAFNFDYLIHANEIFFLKERLYSHLIHDNYMSATMTISGAGGIKKMFGYRRALNNIARFLECNHVDVNIEKEVGHAFIFLTIIQLVRICGQINTSNKKDIYKFIAEIIADNNVRKYLKYYSPSDGDSKIIPILMKLRLVWLVIMVCKYKASKRYKRKL